MKPSSCDSRHPATRSLVSSRRLILLLLLSLSCNAFAFDLRGHVKLQGNIADLPDDSLLRDFSDDPAVDSAVDLRANLEGDAGSWRWHADYQLSLLDGDRVALQQQVPAIGFGGSAFTDDDQRVMDLAHRISDEDDRILGHRLDRFFISHSGEQTVWRIGRQAISWGNGMIYNPVDFFNPFDPAAVDTEYKTGDDMIYAQQLFDSGDDLQAVWVGRRDSDGHVDAEVASLALKYHGFSDRFEYDLLAAEHFDQSYFAAGAVIDVGESIWRGDLLRVDSDGQQFDSAVLNWSYSFIAWRRNFSVTVEYYRNGFGIDDGDYGPASLAANPGLVSRITRGELFSLGKNYLAAATTIELSPLWLASLSLFNNLDDDSRLLQVFSRHDLQQDLQLLIALNLPRGDDGSEFGGIDAGLGDQTLAVGNSLFAQLAWYF